MKEFELIYCGFCVTLKTNLILMLNNSFAPHLRCFFYV